MNEILKVNSKTDILEFKRKHNLLVGKGTIKTSVSNIKQLTNADIENLSCGDVVLKEDSSGKHAYLVSFKSDTGLCLTYCDAYCVETQSYDKSENNWVYNSEDKTIIAEPRMENIVDRDGHKRFQDGNIKLSGVGVDVITKIYGKWSLSGTHLMFVFAGFIPNETVLTSGFWWITENLPEWIADKIAIVFAQNSILTSNVILYADDYTSQSVGCTLQKRIDNKQIQLYVNSITLNKDRKFRVQFDLLIDNAEPETQGE